MRIPLIIHLPSRMQGRLKWDTKSVAFTKDITPSLYYLLGHRPIVANRIFGKPLFVESDEEQQKYFQESYVIASSYGAAYGVLSGEGRWLFVADAVKDKDYFFDLQSPSNGNLDHFTPAVRARNQELIRELIGAVNELYSLKEKPQTAGAFDIGRQGRSTNE